MVSYIFVCIYVCLTPRRVLWFSLRFTGVDAVQQGTLQHSHTDTHTKALAQAVVQTIQENDRTRLSQSPSQRKIFAAAYCNKMRSRLLTL